MSIYIIPGIHILPYKIQLFSSHHVTQVFSPIECPCTVYLVYIITIHERLRGSGLMPTAPPLMPAYDMPEIYIYIYTKYIYSVAAAVVA